MLRHISTSKYVSFAHAGRRQKRGDVASKINHRTAQSTSMLRNSSLHFYGKILLPSKTNPSTINTMMFSRNTLLAAAAAFYGASSVSAFAPSTGE
jgi:hypothetical protein